MLASCFPMKSRSESSLPSKTVNLNRLNPTLSLESIVENKSKSLFSATSSQICPSRECVNFSQKESTSSTSSSESTVYSFTVNEKNKQKSNYSSRTISTSDNRRINEYPSSSYYSGSTTTRNGCCSNATSSCKCGTRSQFTEDMSFELTDEESNEVVVCSHYYKTY